MSVSRKQGASSNPSGVQTLSFTPLSSIPAHEEGRMFWDSDKHVLTIYNDEQDVSLQVGEEMYVRVKNESGATIPNGAAVYISGESGDLPKIELAQADLITTSTVIGIVTHSLENNTEGYITTFGLVRSLDTSSFVSGDILYLSSSAPGVITKTPPTGLNQIVVLGLAVCIDAATGTILVHIDNRGSSEEAEAEIWEQGNAVETVINTVSTFVPVVTITNSGSLLGWTHNGAGALTVIAGGAGKYQISCSLSSQAVSTNKTYEFAIAVDGVIQTKTSSERRYSTGDIGNQSLTGIVTVAVGQVLTIQVQNVTDDANIIVKTINLNMHILK